MKRLPLVLRITFIATLMAAIAVFGSAGSAFALSSISGRVELWGSPGTALPGVRVEVFDAEDLWADTPVRTVLGSAIVDASGNYTVTDLPNATPVIIAFEDLTGVYRDQVYWFSGLPLEESHAYLTPVDDALTGVDVWLRPIADLIANRVYRVAGPDRYGTSAAISKSYFASADTVVIASGLGFADALSAAPLAGVNDAPILLTKPTALPDVIGDEIERLGATHAYIIGSTVAVSDVVKAQLTARGITSITRLGGANRYATAEQVIYALPAEYFEGGTIPFVCRGDSFADALAASPISAHYGLPILLTTTTKVPVETARAWKYMVDRGSDLVFVVGSEQAVSDNILGVLDSYVPSGLYFARFAGPDRYATAYSLATSFGPWDIMGLASGADFPDALSGGAALGHWGGCLALSMPDYLTYSENTLEHNGPYVNDLEVYGSTKALTAATFDNAVRMLNISERVYDIDNPTGWVMLSSTSPLSLFLNQSIGVAPTGARPTSEERSSERIDLRSLATEKWSAE
ncbi:MAG: hypothetical protein CVT59_09720 [Actinobacteria bacterium HGW-Actinobacteria-1]|nr:MAG: hypothetical protein CVT59_09720 [Actinobacteria bacterium HGW-Actinobacteria-1]